MTVQNYYVMVRVWAGGENNSALSQPTGVGVHVLGSASAAGFWEVEKKTLSHFFDRKVACGCVFWG